MVVSNYRFFEPNARIVEAGVTHHHHKMFHRSLQKKTDLRLPKTFAEGEPELLVRYLSNCR
ncbi:hypothetical protein BJV82DRAFT_131554 [Fennellomyces sp. T-0311]|nr:hypothetical protein BJV82DRAFT_131554 [Fennellomyces sp. T-0311]